MKKLLDLSITPLLAAIYPVLFYWSVNVNQVGASQVWRSLLVAAALGLVIAILLWVVIRDPAKASLLGSIALLLFFSYGHLYQWSAAHQIAWIRYSYLIPFFLLIFGFLVFLILRTKNTLRRWVAFANVLLLLLIVYASIPITRSLFADLGPSGVNNSVQSPSNGSNQPDIYLIVVDEYPRADVLQKTFQFDNSPFLDELSTLGFRVIPCSQSNYRWTIQALYAMLNLEYAPPDPNDKFAYTNQTITNKLSKDIKNGFLMNSLHEKGYQVVAFETGYAFTELDDADVFMTSNRAETFFPFEIGLIETTMLSAVDDLSVRVFATASNSPKPSPRIPRSDPRYYYNIKMDGFNNLDKSLTIPGPKFVFAHLLGSHFPIAIDKDGNFKYIKGMPAAGYLGQLEYTNKRLMASLKELIHSSSRPPIVLLLSDHGLKYDDFDTTGDYTDSLLNLAAIYGPDDLTGAMYDSITPINILRLTATHLGIGTYGLLEDHSFYNDPVSTELLDHPNTCQGTP